MKFLSSFFILVSSYCSAISVSVIGDSISMPYREKLPNYYTWPVLLEADLRDSHPEITIYNHAKSGSSSLHAVRVIDSVIEKFDPDVLFLCTGFNDFRFVYIFQIRAHLEYIIQQCQKNKTEVILGLLDLTHRKVDVKPTPAYTKKFKQLFIDLAEQYNLVSFDFVGDEILTNPDYLLRDQTHPNAAGSMLIMEKAKEALFKVIDKIDQNSK